MRYDDATCEKIDTTGLTGLEVDDLEKSMGQDAQTTYRRRNGKLKATEEKTIPRRILAGIEFIRLTYWDRFNLNEALARFEQKFIHETPPAPDPEQNVIWRGNQRRHYRLNTENLPVHAELDFRPQIAKVYKARILNISPAGCLIELPAGEDLEPQQRISRMKIQFEDSAIMCRAQIVHVSREV